VSVLAGIGGRPIEHPPFSPDLVPCDFWLFLVLSCELQGQKFDSSIKVLQATSTVPYSVSDNSLLHMLRSGWSTAKKSMAFEGNYFEETVPKPQMQKSVSRHVTFQTPHK
jgi:hypothetical protein